MAIPYRDTCPVCGGVKRGCAKTCRRCSRIGKPATDSAVHWDRVSDAWASEFCGLFAGEGYAGIVKNSYGYYMVRLQIVLRDDDAPMIYDIQEKLGGRVRKQPRRHAHHGDQISWTASNPEHVEEICRLILERTVIPNKKLNDIRQVLDYVAWRKSFGRNLPKDMVPQAQARALALRESRKYQSHC